MALLERVGTLLRANLNDMIDRAEDPAKMIRQVILDMENQLLQVKTQVAIGIADLHLLQKKSAENAQKTADYRRKAELALDRADEALARAALERSIDNEKLAKNFDDQIADQKVQVENLRDALRSLEAKLTEAKGRSELLLAKQRRARAAGKANAARSAVEAGAAASVWDRMSHKIESDEALTHAHAELLESNLEDRFAALEKQEQVDRLLSEMRMKRLT